MAQSFHVAGESIPYVRFNGTGLEQLGICGDDGVTVREQVFNRPIHTDVSGAQVPAEQQRFGSIHRISFQLPVWDETILDQVRKHTNAAAVGNMPSMGRLIYSNNHHFQLLLQCPQDQPYRWFVCLLDDMQEVNLGTVASAWRLSITAFPPIGTATTALNVPLYDRTFA